MTMFLFDIKLRGCIIGLHDWTKWETVSKGRYVDEEGRKTGDFLRQKRECSKCGVVKTRTERFE